LNSSPVIRVVAAALIDADDRVLLAQRPAGKHLAGGWEFPGGKLEPGENRLAGLARELHEELGVTLRTPRPLTRVRHAYPSREVLLDVWIVRDYSGTPEGLDGQSLRWCTRAELATVDLLPADGPIVRLLWLPERLMHPSSAEYDVVPPEADSNPMRLRGVFCQDAAQAAAAAAGGADFVVLRERMVDAGLAALCGAVPLPVYARGISLSEAWVLGATGVNAT
jgi:mutator protein MutT